MNPNSRLPRRVLASALIALSLFSVTACTSKNDDNQATSASVDYDAPIVTVTNPGAEPTQVLAYNLAETESSRTLTVTQGFGQASGAPGVTPHVTSTELALPLTITGSSLKIGKPSGSNADLNSDIASAEGFGVDLESNASGAVTAATFSAPAQASDVARSTVETSLSQLLSMPIVFPDTPLGTGATWDVALTVDDPTTISRTITYTLNSVEGSKVTLGVQVAQRPTVTSLSLDQSALGTGSTPSSGSTSEPASPSGTDAEVGGEISSPGSSASQTPQVGPAAQGASSTDTETLDITDVITTMSSGTVIIDLASLVPVAGSIDETTRVTYRNTSDPTDDTVVVQDTRRGLSWK